MKILLYNPDNGVTRNFMPHLWMFLLQALTPPPHQVILIDGNAKAMSRQELVEFCRREHIELVGIGAMTRMVARSYSPERNVEVLEALKDKPIGYRISHLVSRFFFRGIYFPQMNKRAWLKLLYDNRKAISGLTKEGARTYRKARKNKLSNPVKDDVFE